MAGDRYLRFHPVSDLRGFPMRKIVEVPVDAGNENMGRVLSRFGQQLAVVGVASDIDSNFATEVYNEPNMI